MSQLQSSSNWTTSTLGKLLIRSGEHIDPSKLLTRDTFYIGLENIESNTGLLVSNGGNDELDLKSIKNVFHKNDILYGKLRPYLSKVYLAKETGICSTDIWVLRATDLVDIEYIFYYLRSPIFLQRISLLTMGANLPRADTKGFDNIPIPLPPLPEQRRIAAILREADEIRKLRQRANEKTQEIVRSLFYDMFGDPETNPREWEEEFLSQLGVLDRGKSQHRPRDAAHLYGGPYPFIQTGNIANSNGWITNYTQTYSEAGLNQSRLWPKGTLCITIAANIAKTGILTFDACFPDSVVGFTPGVRVITEYIRQWFVTIQGKLEQIAPQAAQKNINLDVLRKLTLPVPPKELQEDYLLP